MKGIRAMLADVLLCQQQSEDAYALRVLRTERALKTAGIADAVKIDAEYLRKWMDGAVALAEPQLQRVRDFIQEVQ
jgi:hypothetical protein